MVDRTKRYRPAPGGVSVGHRDITAGTLSCWVKKAGQLYLLSNNHVLANVNAGKKGDPILQPGAADGGTAVDELGKLYKFVPISLTETSGCPFANVITSVTNFFARLFGRKTRLKAFIPGEPNLVDCAIAEPTRQFPYRDEDVLDAILEDDGALVKIAGEAEPEIGLAVKKSGRCFTKDTLILTNPAGPKTVNELKIGDLVFSFNEDLNAFEKKPIINILPQGRREVYLVKTRNRAAKLTDNHPLLVVNKDKLQNKQGRWINQYNLGWKVVNSLTRGDIIATLHHIDSGENFIGDDFARFLGFFLGDGSARYKYGCGGRVVLYCSNEEEATLYSDIIERTFNIPSHFVKCLKCGYEYKSQAEKPRCTKCSSPRLKLLKTEPKRCTISRCKNVWRVFYSNSDTAKKLLKLFPGKKLKRELPDVVWTLPLKERLAFIEGYVDADGHRWRHPSGRHTRAYSFCSPNQKLITLLRELCIYSGVRVTNLASRTKQGFKPGNVWEFSAYPDNDKKKQCIHVCGNKGIVARCGIERYSLPSELQLEPVVKIESVGYEDTYDIEVAGSHNFIGNGVVLHNTTGTTHGEISQVEAAVTVNMGDNRSALFVDQIIVEKEGMSAGGDSGSAVLTEEGNKIVGLLFAGSEKTMVANSWKNVKKELGIELE